VLHKWKLTGIIASLVIVLIMPIYALKETRLRATQPGPVSGEVTFVGREKCIDCHKDAYDAWRGSDHDNAMAVASDSTVLGDFNEALFEQSDITARFFKNDGGFFVHTQGPDGVPADFEVTHTFGVTPLQQYLIPFPGGRLQALTIAWDTQSEEWFYLYPGQDIPPDDWLHWTRGAQTWNGMCAECHSTNLIKNYDPKAKTFNTTWSEINVSCEACHGPGSRHVAWAEIPPMARPDSEAYELVNRTSGISSRQQVELCAPCHARRTELGDYDHTRPDLLDNIVPTNLDEGLYFADGQIDEEVYVYGSFVQSKMYKNDVRCSDCHEVHSLELIEQGNALCLRCHQSDVYDSYDHHFHKTEHEGKPSDGHLCVKCHMPERPYMVVDWRADHSIRVPRPDLTLEIGTPNACNQVGCHNDKPDEWSAEHYARWYGQARKPHYGTVVASGRARAPQAHGQLVRLAGDNLYPAIARATALSLLGAYPEDENTPAFARALSDEEALVRHTAVSNINLSDPKEMVEMVAPLLFDHVRAVRMQAAVRLAGLPSELFKPYQQEALDETLAEYKQAMEYSLDFAFAGHNLGNLYAQLNEPGRAASYYKTAVEIDGLFYPAKVNLAMLYNSQGQNEEAEKLFREIIEDYPDQYEIAYSLGLLLAELNRLDEAVVYLKRAASGMPNRARVLYNLGLLQQHLGRVPEAEAALTRIVEMEPNNLDYMHALVDHYIKRGELRKALPIANKMISSHPDQKIGHDVKAFIEQQLGAESPPPQ
jgi:tetratricopeptide (TPR) repeat protein